MKQVLIFTIACLVSTPVLAQPASGKFFVGGHFSLYGTVDKSKSGSTTEKDGSTTYFTITPLVGYFLNDRISVGAGIGYDTQIEKDPQSNVEKSTTSKMVFNPFARYYLISGTGGIFAEASMGYSFGTNKTFTDGVVGKDNVFGFSALLSPGVYYYVTPRLAIEAKFGWFGVTSETTKLDDDQKDVHNTFGIDISPDSFIFGLTYIL